MVSTDSDLATGSSVEAWARGHLNNADLAHPARKALSGLVATLVEERERVNDVFLTVVVRTQLRRWEQLQDALLCLAAQTDSDFEVLLMLHNVQVDQMDQIRSVLRTYPSSFADRVKLCEVHGGGRTRPLNLALNEVRGGYVAFFDDDDLLMANWVEAFRDGAARAPGQLIRANVAVQRNRIEQWTDGASGQRSVETASAEYAEIFNIFDNIERNHTPFMGFAFPRSFFGFWGEKFDEELPVCEDWDAVLRAAALVGVYSSEQLTAIYRQWEDARTSYTSHDLEEWAAAEQRVRDKINQSPFFVPTGGASMVLETTKRFRENERRLAQRQEDLINSTSWRLLRPLRGAVRVLRRLLHYGNRS